MWEVIANELSAGIPSWEQWVRASVRIVLAGVLGAIVGLQREAWAKPAGLRTHMLVAMGCAVFVFAALESGVSADAASRVIQGVAAGIGFIGAGAILKLPREREVEGLTTAAGIWITAAFGMAVGLGRLGSAITSAVLAFVVLEVVGWLERRRTPPSRPQPD
jgi:putative Mg2+ transporter-C (MgtC) family protein